MRPLHLFELLFVFAVVAFVSRCQPGNSFADEYPPGYAIRLDERVNHIPKFQRWYQYYAPQLSYVSEKKCNLSLKSYEGDGTSRLQQGPVGSYCYAHNDCILQNLVESIKAHMAAAAVVLGLVPPILATLGPTLGEISLLAWRRPLLALLLAMGAPAIYPSRMLQSDDPAKLLQSVVPIVSTLPAGRGALATAVVVGMEYALPLAAIVNVILTSYELGTKTVLSWDCGNSMMPLMWSILPALIQAPAAVGFHLSRRRYEASGWLVLPSATRSSSFGGKLAHLLRAEFTPYAAVRLAAPKGKDVKPRTTTIYLYNLAAFGNIIHLIIGTTVYSSLLYIGVIDAMILLIRYGASALVCRLIVCYELCGLQKSRDAYQSLGGSGQEVELERIGGDR
jgi:hypothetical protein